MSTTQRVVRKQLAGAEDLLQGVGTVTQTRGGGTYDIHKLDVPIPMTSIAEMQASSAEFVRLYWSDTRCTDFRRNPEGTTGLPSILGGTWEEVGDSLKLRELLVKQFADSGITIANGSFEQGVTGVTQGTGVYQESTGKVYQWQSASTLNITAGTLPGDYGTIGVDWVDKSSNSLRLELKSKYGAEIIGTLRGVSNEELTSQELLDNTCARSLLEFIPRSLWSGVRDGTNTSDISTYIQNAVDSGEHIRQLERLQLRIDSPIKLYGGVLYDFGFSTLLPTDAFGAIQNKTFSADLGQYVSGQYWTLKNLFITGDATKKYNSAGAGILFNKDSAYSAYDGTIENVAVRDMYYCLNDLAQSAAWMFKYKHLKGINCPVGFAKSVGTTLTFENCYMLGGHRGFLLDNIFGFDMLACAHDASTDYATDFLDSRFLVTNSQGNIHSLRAEGLSANKRAFRFDNSSVNIGVLTMNTISLDSTSNSVNVIEVNSGSKVNIGSIKMPSATLTGSNTKHTIGVNSSSYVTLRDGNIPYIDDMYAATLNGGTIKGSSVPSSKLLNNGGFVEQTKSVSLYLSSSGSDTNNGLLASTPKLTMAGIIEIINARYAGCDVTVYLGSSTTFAIDGVNKLLCKKLSILNYSTFTGSLQFNVSGGIAAKIYGPTEIVLKITALSVNGAPGSFVNGILFPSAYQDYDYSLDSLQINAGTITLAANSALTGCVLYGYNGMMSIGLRDSAVTGASATTSYICYLGSGTAQITRGGGSLTTCGLTNGTQIASSPLYYA